VASITISSSNTKKQLSTSHIAERKFSDQPLLQLDGMENNQNMIHHGLELRSSHIAGGNNNAKGGASTQKGPSSDKKSLKEQQMRAREKMLINNGGTVLGSHSMPHAMMNLHQ